MKKTLLEADRLTALSGVWRPTAASDALTQDTVAPQSSVRELIDRRFIGHSFAPFSVPVEAGRLRFFSKAIDQIDPIYSDIIAARAAGHPDLPVPPTFLFCLEMDGPNPAELRELLGIDYRRLLHGEQRFVYHLPIHAGDLLRFEARIEDIYSKRNGALEFVVRCSRVHNCQGMLVADLRSVVVVRNKWA